MSRSADCYNLFWEGIDGGGRIYPPFFYKRSEIRCLQEQVTAGQKPHVILPFSYKPLALVNPYRVTPFQPAVFQPGQFLFLPSIYSQYITQAVHRQLFIHALASGLCGYHTNLLQARIPPVPGRN